MRPDRGVVKEALARAKKDKQKAAALLGCSRQTIYTWIYQLGLEREAGIRLDRRGELDSLERQVTRHIEENNVGVYSRKREAPTLRLVEARAAEEHPVQATMRISPSLWRRVKIEAIRRNVKLGTLVEELFERGLGDAAVDGKKGKAKA